MKPIRIQRKRTKGWKMPANTIYVGRPGKWGNPFNLTSSDHCWTALAQGFRADAKGRRAASVAMFLAWIKGGKPVTLDDCGFYAESKGKREAIALSPPIKAGTPPTLKEIRSALRGKNLACFCSLDQPCHADVLLELANRPATEGERNV